MSRIRKLKYDFSGLHKYFGTTPTSPITGYFYYDHGEYIPWNKGKKGLQKSNKKGGNREDLSPEARKRIAEKVRAYRLGKKHSQKTKDKLSKLKTGVPRPDLIGNKFTIGRSNAAFRTEAFREKMRAVANRRWGNV